MKKLWYELRQLCQTNKEGSRATQAKRYRDLKLIASTLERLGYRHMSAHSLKAKHVYALVHDWQARSLTAGTIKVRMATVRWWSRKVDRHYVVARRNAHYGIGRRVFITEHSKACHIPDDTLKRIHDPYVAASIQLAKAFGLRKEEAIKFNPVHADQGDHIKLKGSWCKGGRQRYVPILTQAQRHLLDDLKLFVGANSLIPSDKTFAQQRARYESITRHLGLKKLHGLRHAYAQQRYCELTGWECSHKGGLHYQHMTMEQKKIDRDARLTISNELGHNRIGDVAIYIGK